ncbi:DNA-binding transcriptional regulator, LysR family [Collimonas sp. OK607]|uniref:LysR substrate-binding domain-containing protein n=1 Tax=Collimonas sp. OK607 TaxID=1798194 RepID=UPI0008E95CE7|nr:LysR substrate-binding domain-containing protein [Collimonas sp. OK607]SFB38340.1 DNA-binding transcriptional regulator, LysR family [Collimonas sp. OK607]
MDDFNDLYYFAAVIRHNGFSAASRAIGIEKTKLSRRVADLEKKLGVRLLHRSTRSISLTDAGERFYAQCINAVEGAQAAYDSMNSLRTEPAGIVRMSCPVVLAQNYLAPILPGYMASHPKVTVFIEATDRAVNLIEERFDMALVAAPEVDMYSDLVAQELGSARRILVASPNFLELHGHPNHPAELSHYKTIGRIADLQESQVRWHLTHATSPAVDAPISPSLISSDSRVQLEAAVYGIGIALLAEPIVSANVQSGALEHVLPEWSASAYIIHLVYPPPRGMLPSVRSLIDYLIFHLPAGIQERSV